MSAPSAEGVAEPRVTLHSLSLENFRNYAHLALSLAPGLNVFEGDNGAGKTNLLEAVVYLALARSPRAAGDAQLIRYGSDAFALRALHSREAQEPVRSVAVSYARDRRKVVQVQDGRPAPAAALYGELLVTLFTPDDLWLVKGPPAGRRALLDRLLVQASPLYANSAIRYRRALLQRNAALREVRARRSPPSVLAAWDAQLVQYGAEILARRDAALAALQPQAAAAHAQLNEGREPLVLRYAPALDPGPAPTPLTAEQAPVPRWAERLRSAIGRTRATDLARAATTCGPHRDDVDILLGAHPARLHASQGQQRSIVLALKFAEREFLRQATGRLPVLLVDDVLSELDPLRRSHLAQLLMRAGQVLLTTADGLIPSELAAAARYMVREARVYPLRGGTA